MSKDQWIFDDKTDEEIEHWITRLIACCAEDEVHDTEVLVLLVALKKERRQRLFANAIAWARNPRVEVEERDNA